MLAERRNSKASSDLPKKIETEKKRKRRGKPGGSRGFFVFSGVFEGGKGGSFTAHWEPSDFAPREAFRFDQIGRASCRERV